MSDKIEFYLPLGLMKDGKAYRKGKMHLATASDELEIQNYEEVGVNTRYRDIILLSKVIDEIEDIKPITPEMVEDLFEADFLYLQLLYKEINGETDSHTYAKCPKCQAKTVVQIKDLYKDMTLYK